MERWHNRPAGLDYHLSIS